MSKEKYSLSHLQLKALTIAIAGRVIQQFVKHLNCPGDTSLWSKNSIEECVDSILDDYLQMIEGLKDE